MSIDFNARAVILFQLPIRAHLNGPIDDHVPATLLWQNLNSPSIVCALGGVLYELAPGNLADVRSKTARRQLNHTNLGALLAAIRATLLLWSSSALALANFLPLVNL